MRLLFRIVGVVLLMVIVFSLFSSLVLGSNNVWGYSGSVVLSSYVLSSGVNVTEINDLVVEVGNIIDHVRNLVVSAEIAHVYGVDRVRDMLNNATVMYLKGVDLFLSKHYNESLSYLREARVLAVNAWDSAISLVYNYLSVRLDSDISVVGVIDAWVSNASGVIDVNFTGYVLGLRVVRDYFNMAGGEFRLYLPANRSSSDHLANALTYLTTGHDILRGLIILMSNDVSNFIDNLKYNASVVLSNFDLITKKVSNSGISLPDDVRREWDRAREEYSAGDRAYNSVNKSNVSTWNNYITAVINYKSAINSVNRARLLLHEHLRNIAVSVIKNDMDSISRAYNVPGVSVGALDREKAVLDRLRVDLESAVSVDDLINVINQGRVVQKNVEYIVKQAAGTVTSDVSNIVMFVFVVFVVILLVFILIIVNRRSKVFLSVNLMF